jgi:ribosomal protein L10
MSKLVKELVIKDLRRQLSGVNDALLVNVVGLNAMKTSKLRKELRGKNMQLEVVKNSLARRAAEGTPLAAAFQGIEGTLAIVWGGEDIVALAKEVARIAGAKEFEGFEARGGAIDGAKLSPAQVKAVSTWPTRQEQLSLLVGQILAPGAILVGQLKAAGGVLAGQIKQRIEDLEKNAPAAAAEAAPAGTASESPAGAPPASALPESPAG